MAMRKDQIADNKFTLPNDARDLALYVRQITQNVKVFDPAIDANLPAQLRATADQIYFDIFEANGVRVDSADTKKERLALQKRAIRLCTRMLALMDMARRCFHLSGKRCVFWGRNVRLRSANRGNANNVFNVNSDGNVNNWNATNTLRSAPDWTAASPQRLLRNKGWA